MFYDETFLEMLNPKMFLEYYEGLCITRKNCATITKMESHVFFPYCLRSLILIVSSRNTEKAGDSYKRYDL